MNLERLTTGLTDWAELPAAQYAGTSGTATVQARQLDDVQLRRIVYSAGYLADHWCRKGHLIVVLSGELTVEREGEREPSATVTFGAGAVYHLAEHEYPPHRVRSQAGATVIVID